MRHKGRGDHAQTVGVSPLPPPGSAELTMRKARKPSRPSTTSITELREKTERELALLPFEAAADAVDPPGSPSRSRAMSAR